MKIKKGDTVQIISGKDAGKTGDVQTVLSDKNKVVVEGVNVIKRHRRANQRGQEAGIIERPAAIDVSNVKLLCPKCKLPTRIGYIFEDDKKLRQCKKCNKSFE